MASPDRRLRHRFSRHRHNPAGLDYAWVCAECGYIRLGPPCATEPPEVPFYRCSECRALAWVEQAIPPLDPALFDQDRSWYQTVHRQPSQPAALPSPFRH